MATETQKEKLLRWVTESAAAGQETYYCEIGRYKPFKANTVAALVKDGSVKITSGRVYDGYVYLALVAK